MPLQVICCLRMARMMFNQDSKIETIDLTKIIDENLYIYTQGQYSDPPFRMETWCTVESQGYKVSHLSLGTQTGTHIDAPAHFVASGAELDVLPVEALMGKYLWSDINAVEKDYVSGFGYRGEPILFLTSTASDHPEISEKIFDTLLKLPCKVWVIVYGIRITGQDPFYFNRMLAKAGKYLVEDVDEISAKRVRAGGEIIALPLRLANVSGSPCRVIIRQQAA
jgi:arylformamidase